MKQVFAVLPLLAALAAAAPAHAQDAAPVRGMAFGQGVEALAVRVHVEEVPPGPGQAQAQSQGQGESPSQDQAQWQDQQSGQRQQ